MVFIVAVDETDDDELEDGEDEFDKEAAEDNPFLMDDDESLLTGFTICSSLFSTIFSFSFSSFFGDSFPPPAFFFDLSLKWVFLCLLRWSLRENFLEQIVQL